MELKNFQKQTIKKVVDLLKTDRSIILKSPVGSGKTVMASNIIKNLAQDENNDFFVIWISVGKGNLHEQSFNAVANYVKDLECNLINELTIQSKSIFNNHSINFINWESITKTNKNNEFTNTLMKEQEHNNFIDLVNNSKQLGLKCICFIDEAHIGAMKINSNAYDVLNTFLKPDKIVYLSATPLSLKDSLLVEVNISDVIEEGLIKQSIIINDFEKTKSDETLQESSSFLLEQAIKKQTEIKKAYENMGYNVNPLVLIQVQNAKIGQKQIDLVIEILNKANITIQNEKLKIWLDSNTLSKEEQNDLKKWDSKTSFLIFKTAIATGWDCPRSCILVKFRESKSDTFDIQTIGRIYRSIDGNKHNNNLIDNGFIYTDIKNFDLSNLDYKFIQYEQTALKPTIKDVNLPSYVYKTIKQENLLDTNFKKFLNNSFIKYKNELNVQTNLEINTLYSSKIENRNLKSFNTMNKTDVLYDEIFLEKKLDNILKQWNKKYLLANDESLIDYLLEIALNNLKTDDNFDFMSFVINNELIFDKILDDCLVAYKISINKITQNIERTIFNLPKIQYYNDESWTKENNQVYSKYAYEDVVFEKSMNILELAFLQTLQNDDNVLWYYRNKQTPSADTLNIVYLEKDENGVLKQRLFLPDFIVMFKNNKIGIFDTKASNNRIDIENYEENTKNKNIALQKYLKDNNLIGGMVVSGICDKEITAYGDFKVFVAKNYKNYEEDKENWIDFKEIYKKV